MVKDVGKISGIEHSQPIHACHSKKTNPVQSANVTFDNVIGDDFFFMAGEHLAKSIKYGYVNSRRLNKIAQLLDFVNPTSKTLFKQLTDRAGRQLIRKREDLIALGKLRIATMLLSDGQLRMPQPEKSTQELTIRDLQLDDLIPMNCLMYLADQFVRVSRSGAMTDDKLAAAEFQHLKPLRLDKRLRSLILDSKQRELRDEEKIEFAKLILSGIVITEYAERCGGFSF